MTVNIRSVQRLAERSEKPVAISIERPFPLACQLTGIEDLARAVIADPEFVRLLLVFTARVAKKTASLL